MTNKPDEGEENILALSGWPMFAGCGCLWTLIGWAVLAGSAMFLVNPRLNSGAMLAAMGLVWIVGWLYIYRAAFDKRED